MSWYESRMILMNQSQRSIWRQVCTPCLPISCFNLIPCILNISQTIKIEKHKKEERGKITLIINIRNKTKTPYSIPTYFKKKQGSCESLLCVKIG